MSHVRHLSFKKENLLSLPNQILTPSHHPKSLSKDFDFLSNELTSRNTVKNKISLKHSEGKGNILLSSAENSYRTNAKFPNPSNIKSDSSKLSLLKINPNSAVKLKTQKEELFTSPNTNVLFTNTKFPKSSLIKTFMPSGSSKKKLKLKVNNTGSNYVALTSTGNECNENDDNEQFPYSQRTHCNSKINIKCTNKFSQTSTKASDNQTLDKYSSKYFINGGPIDNVEDVELLMVSIIQQTKNIHFD